MDRDTFKPEVPESLVTDGIIHDFASEDLTASLQNELSSRVRSALGVTGHQENNVCKCELFPTNIRPNSPDHQEEIKQNTSIPAVKQEIIDIFPKREITEDVFKEEINDNPIKGEIREYIKLACAMNCSQLGTVRTDTQPAVIKTGMTEAGAQEDFEGPMNSGKPGINKEICKVKIDNVLIEPTVRDKSDLVMTGPQEENVCKCEHQEDNKQETLIPAVKPEVMDIVIKKEETDVVFKEKIHDNQIIKDEIQDCKEYIKLEDGMKYPWVDNLTETVNSESQSDVMENELSEEDGLQEERINGDSDKEGLRFSKRVLKTRILAGAVTIASMIERSDSGESHSLSSGDHEDDGNKCSKSKHQPHRYKRLKKIRPMDAEEYSPQKGDSWHGNKNKSGQGFCRDTHRRSHNADRLHQCEVCAKYFKTPVTLRNHLHLHSDQLNSSHQEVKQFTCTDCGKSFSLLRNLKKHQLLHTGKKLFACEICSKTYAQPDGLHKHLITHKEVKPFSCADCGKSFSQSSNQRTHQLLHTGKTLFTCEICDKSYAQPAGLDYHMRTHREVKPFSCADCGKSFGQLCHLKRHQLLHTGKKLFSCTDCGKFFSRLDNLKSHQLLHTGKKLFTCDICDKSFGQPNGLHRHKKTHQEEKPFSCTDCGKSFSQSCHLKTHQFLHTGKKLFACEICDKSFAQRAGLHSHKITHQEEKPHVLIVVFLSVVSHEEAPTSPYGNEVILMY